MKPSAPHTPPDSGRTRPIPVVPNPPGDSGELEKDAAELHRVLTELLRVYQSRNRKQICCEDISVTQCFTLAALVDLGSPTLQKLAGEMYLDKSTTSRVVGSLVRKGLARRVREMGDARIIRVESTDEGRRLYQKIRERLIEEEKLLVADVDPQVRRATAELIARLACAAKERLSREDVGLRKDTRAHEEGNDMDIKKEVRERYADAARRVREQSEKTESPDERSCCCGDRAGDEKVITGNLYDDAQLKDVPLEAALASLGCGNPTALAELKTGEVVLDLGSGGGIDVILTAKRVGPSGIAYGLDMTDEMLDVARENQRKAGVENVEFLKGEIEDIPLSGSSVDVVISNCVINLSPDKPRVLREAFRVLKPGGRLAVSDIVSRGPIPDDVRRDMELWTGCIAGALEENQYRRYLENAGFEQIDIEPTRVFRLEQGCCSGKRIQIDESPSETPAEGTFMSAFIRAVKPGGTA